MALDREFEVLRTHAAAIVADPDQRRAAGGGDDLDPSGARIDGVFDELLDDAGRPLDHFAGGDAVDHVFGKAADGHRLDSSRGKFDGFAPAEKEQLPKRQQESGWAHQHLRASLGDAGHEADSLPGIVAQPPFSTNVSC